MRVTIPGRREHLGFFKVTVTIADTCPVCGGPRGKPFKTLSYDGSRRLPCDGWVNPCGHVDTYIDVRAEARVSSFEDDGFKADVLREDATGAGRE